MLKLPREVEADPRCAAIEKLLSHDLRPLWEGGKLTVAHVPYTPALAKALADALRDSHLARGLEKIGTILAAEQKGLTAVRDRQGAPPPLRVSRVLVIPDDCGQRYYRNSEAILFHHSDRLLGLRVAIPYSELSKPLFGADALVKALLVTDRKAVARVLWGLGGIRWAS